MDSVRDIHCWMGCPIRRSRDQRALASTPGFSQRATSFIASRCQGIHQMPLPQRLIAQTRRLQRQALPTTGPRVKTLIPKKPEARTQKPETGPLPNIRTPSAFTEASVPPSATTADGSTPPRLTPSSPVKDHTAHKLSPAGKLVIFPDRLDPLPEELAGSTRAHSVFLSSVRPPPLSRLLRNRCRGSRRTMLRIVRAVVEVIGIEPTTSCLQSRRSPN